MIKVAKAIVKAKTTKIKMKTKATIKILAIETASEACSAALLISDIDNAKSDAVNRDHKQKIYLQIELTPRQHAKKILSMLGKVLEQGNTELNEVDAIAFGQGPGAFTGLRIAAGVAQGVSLSVGKPVVPVSTLAALARQTIVELKNSGKKYQGEIIATALDARMGEVYWGLFKSNEHENNKIESLCEEQVSKPQEMLINLKAMIEKDNCKALAVGAGWDAYYDDLSQKEKLEGISHLSKLFPTASSIAELALSLLKDGKAVASEDAQPVYIRNDVAKKSLKQ